MRMLKVAAWLVLGLFVLLMAITMWLAGQPTHNKTRVSNKAFIRQTVASIAPLRDAIERYKLTTGSYPTDASVLLREGYIDNFPSNVYAVVLRDLPCDDKRALMRDVPLDSKDYAGNFHYEPVTVKGKVKAYSLKGFAPDNAEMVRSGTAASHVVATFYRMSAEEKAALREEERKYAGQRK